ncbi:hypothetical protein P7C70_g1965, partial [Phenoliferia sp. Uapishka_3]
MEDRLAIVSNTPHTQHDFPISLALGIFDGHRGPWAADYISVELPRRLLVEPHRDRRAIFEELDHSMLGDFRNTHSRRSKFAQKLGIRQRGKEDAARRVLSGSTALVAELDRASMRVHNVGDSRGVFYDAHQASAVPQDGGRAVSTEYKLMLKYQPLVAIGKRLFGQQLATRSFGDAYYKLPLYGHKHFISELSKYQSHSSTSMQTNYATLFHDYKTPPYLTARPERLDFAPNFFHLQSHPKNLGILASDGLWDNVGNEEAVRILREASGGVNLAEYLLDKVVMNQDGRLPGDDTSIIVMRPTAATN